MDTVYKNPPVIETICQFQFEQDTDLDLVIPGLLYEKTQKTFPKRRQVRTFNVNIPSDTKITGAFEQQIQTIDRVQFLNEDENAIIQVGSHFLSVHHLKPYPSWRKFQSIIKNGFDSYCEVAAPKNLYQVRLRYINNIEFIGQGIGLEEHFNFRPFIATNLPQDFVSFIIGVQFPYEEIDTLKLQLTSAQSKEPNTVSLILDFDYFTIKPGSVPIEKALNWIDIAHTRIEQVFEACITDKMRKKFNEEGV